MKLHRHNPSTVPRPVGQYAQGLEVGAAARVLYISGQIPETSLGDIPTEFDAQCRLVWSHIGGVLHEANGAIRREVLGRHEPALTVVVAQALDPEWLLEIEAIAAA